MNTVLLSSTCMHYAKSVKRSFRDSDNLRCHLYAEEPYISYRLKVDSVDYTVVSQTVYAYLYCAQRGFKVVRGQ